MSNINPTNLNSPTSSTPQPTTQQQLNPSDSKTQTAAQGALEQSTESSQASLPTAVTPNPNDSTSQKVKEVAKGSSNTKNVISQPPTKTRLKSALKDAVLTSTDFICEVVAGTTHGLPHEAAADVKIGLGFTKGLITLPLIALKIGKSIYHGVKIIKYRAELKDTNACLGQTETLQKHLLSNEETEDLRNNTTYTHFRSEILRLETKKKQLEGKISVAKEEMLSCKSIPKDLVDIANSCVHLAATLGGHLKTLSPHILTGLQSAATVLGTVAGSLTIALGLADMAKSVHGLYTSYKKMRILDKKIAHVSHLCTELNGSKKSDKDEAVLAILQLELMSLQKERNIHKSKLTSAVIALAAGTLVVTGGALAISAVFTGGTTALILAGIGFGIGIAVTGIKVGNYIKGKIEENSINKTIREQHPEDSFKKLVAAIKNKSLTEDDLKYSFSLIHRELDETKLKDSLVLPEYIIHDLFPNILERTDLATE